MSLTPAIVDVSGLLEGSSGLVRYLLVFVFAMVPAIELFVVVPVAIGLGLDPIATGVAAFAGSVAAVAVIALFQRSLTAWWERRTDDEDDGTDGASGRAGRARRLVDRYGLPGLAFGGPILAGIHLTALAALLVGTRTRDAVGWLSIGLGAWTVLLVVGSVSGLSVVSELYEP